MTPLQSIPPSFSVAAFACLMLAACRSDDDAGAAAEGTGETSTSGIAGGASTSTAAGSTGEAPVQAESGTGEAPVETGSHTGEAGSSTGEAGSSTGSGAPEVPREPPRWQPSLDRALAALPHADGVYLSWRWFADDPDGIAFHVYRTQGDGPPMRITDRPVSSSTNYVDSEGTLDGETSWHLTAVVDGVEDPTPSAPAWLPAASDRPYFERSTGSTTHGRSLAVGDLRGRGQLDFVLRHSSATIDPYIDIWEPREGRYTLRAFDHEGNQLWQYAMGEAIEPGIWYSPYLVYDLDQDGDAELVVKAGDETLGREELQDESGRVLHGPEYLRVIDGRDGQTVLAQTDWPDREGFRGADPPGTPLEERRYEDYNRQSRNLMAIGFLDGEHPHVIVVRGTYGKHKIAAYRYHEGGLDQAWYWENEDPYALPEVAEGEPGYEAYLEEYRALHRWWGQGAHSIRVADVDDDGRDEVIVGAIALDDDGAPLWSMNRGHVDHVHLGDLDPGRPGLELYYGTERGHDAGGIGMADPATGAFLWRNDWSTSHIHREGLCADLTPAFPGAECYSGEADESAHWLFSSAGEVLSEEAIHGSLVPRAAYWDDDAQRELLAPSPAPDDDLLVAPTDYATGEAYDFLRIPTDTEVDDRQYVQLLAVVDLLGDWREELVYADRGRILIYMSTIPSEHRYPWLMQDPIYRMGVAVSSMGYYQIPLLGEDLQSQR